MKPLYVYQWKLGAWVQTPWTVFDSRIPVHEMYRLLTEEQYASRKTH